MPDITVTNTDWLIVESLKAVLKIAVLRDKAGRKAFETVRVALSREEAADVSINADKAPMAVIVYDETVESLTPENAMGNVLRVTLRLANRWAGDGVSKDGRLQEGLRLVNAAKNAIEDSPPSDATAWGDNDYYQHRLQWGAPRFTEATEQSGTPWIIADLPLAVGFVLESRTSH